MKTEFLPLTFLKEEDGQLAASYSDGGIELTYKGERLVFLPKITYTVTFDTDGGSAVEAVSVVNGRTVDRPVAEPQKTDCVFVGWYSDKNFTRPYDFGSAIVCNTTISQRFAAVVHGQSEYAVDFFDLNYDGGKPSETIGATAGSSKSWILPTALQATMKSRSPRATSRFLDTTKTRRSTECPDFSVADNGLLIWKPVPDAARYYVDVVRRRRKITFTLILTTALRCISIFLIAKMPPEGIVFVVTATAEGYASSVSRAFVYLRKLPVVSGLYLDTEIDLLVWDALDDASDYTVSVNGGAPASTGGRKQFQPQRVFRRNFRRRARVYAWFRSFGRGDVCL